jgi:Protein of unknown function (DUF3485)
MSNEKKAFGYTATVAFIALLALTSGLAHGLLDGRWQSRPDLKQRGAKLSKLPEQLGDWTVLGELEMPEKVQEVLRCYGYNYRTYRNAKTGAQVTLAILFGPRGPIAVHTPDICFSSSGVEAEAARERVNFDIAGSYQSFWNIKFKSKLDGQPSTDVYYAWSDGGPWMAAEEPRYWPTFELFKIQLAGQVFDSKQSSGCREFLELFLPNILELIKSDG